MKLFLIRHGQTDWNVENKIQGSRDTELNNTGIAQAEELSKKIIDGHYSFTKIYSSKQKRAFKTAEILGKAADIAFVKVEGLEEINFGKWEGLSWEEVEANYPEKYKEWHLNRRYTTPPKGESYDHMLNRVLKAIRKIIDENSGDIAIVTHSAVIMCLQCYITNTPFDKMLKFKTPNTAIIELDSEAFER